MEQESYKVYYFIAIAVVVVLGCLFSFTIVSPQQQALVIRLGSINRTLDSGINVKLPWPIEKVVKIDTSIQAVKGKEMAYSKDGQTIDFEATVNYAVDQTQVTTIYKEYKKDYENRIVIPSIKEAIKSVSSKYTAQGIIDNRPKLPIEMREMLILLLKDNGFSVSNVVITNIDFDDAYENAIKEKQIAEQNALKQINVTKQEDEKKKQEILKAEALAEKTRLESQALASQQGEKVINKIYAEAALEAAKKWNGILPTQMIPGQTLPFIQLGK